MEKSGPESECPSFYGVFFTPANDNFPKFSLLIRALNFEAGIRSV